MLGLEGDAQAVAVPGQVARGQAGVGQMPLAEKRAGAGVQADQGGVHAVQIYLEPAGFRPGGHPAVGDDGRRAV